VADNLDRSTCLGKVRRRWKPVVGPKSLGRAANIGGNISPGFFFVGRRTEGFGVEKEGRLSRVQTEPAFDSNREGSGISEAAASVRVHGCDAYSKGEDRSGNKDRGR
jgi:hypothetical protein